MQKQAVRVITTDTVRAGGFAQLEAFIKIRLDSISAEHQGNRRQLADAKGRGHILIDCPGGNPFNDNDIDRQARLIKADAIPSLWLAVPIRWKLPRLPALPRTRGPAPSR